MTAWLDFLKSCVGRPYKDFDAQGNYIGCFEPLYLLWPELPRFKLPERQSAYFAVAYFHFLQNFSPVKVPKPLDVAVFRFPGDIFHVGVYISQTNFIHVQRGNYFEIRRLRQFEKYKIGDFCLREEVDKSLKSAI
jgi:hypothetical protein